MVGQPLLETAEQQLLAPRQRSPDMVVEQALADVVEPVLLVVPKGVDGRWSCHDAGQREACKLTALVDDRASSWMLRADFSNAR